jgi:hypothetical protein
MIPPESLSELPQMSTDVTGFTNILIFCIILILVTKLDPRPERVKACGDFYLLGHFHIMFIPSCAKLNSSYGVAIT